MWRQRKDKYAGRPAEQIRAQGAVNKYLNVQTVSTKQCSWGWTQKAGVDKVL